MSKAETSALESLHNELAQMLRDKIRAGEATAADLSVARQFLKDNNVTSTVTAENPLGGLIQSLPFASEDEADAFLN